MLSSFNLIGLPQDKFGFDSIHIGNFVSLLLTNHDKKLKAQYDSTSNKISILNTSDLPPDVLNKILYKAPVSMEYDVWKRYPVIDETRNKEGNLEISFSDFKPGVDNSTISFNLLGLPQDKFGLDSQFDKSVGQMVAKLNRETKTCDSISNEFSFLKTSDLPSAVHNKILYKAPGDIGNDFFKLHPVINETRNKEGNLEIDFSEFKPGVDRLTMQSGLVIPETLSSRQSLPSINFGCLDEEVIDTEEVSSMKKSIAEGVIGAMSQFFNKHEMGKGIWCPNDYRKYLLDECDIEMDESYCTGFANEKFFEKTGRFTFKLKDEVKASDALLSFLNGPTVADCGNATMACYYKCILDIIGEEKFNQLFSPKSFTLTISQLGITDEASPISNLADYTEAAKQKKTGVLGKRPLRIGEECHFDGIIWYANKHPKGFSGGENVIYVGDDEEGNQLFIAHGFKKPLTEKEIYQNLIESYNQERTPQDEQDVTEAKNPKLYDKRTNRFLISHYIVSEEEVERNTGKFIKGFLVGSIRSLQAKKLVKLKNSNNMNEFKLKLIK